jgi:hypothetical protein
MTGDGGVLSKRRFVRRRSVEEAFCAEPFCMSVKLLVVGELHNVFIADSGTG